MGLCVLFGLNGLGALHHQDHALAMTSEAHGKRDYLSTPSLLLLVALYHAACCRDPLEQGLFLRGNQSLKLAMVTPSLEWQPGVN